MEATETPPPLQLDPPRTRLRTEGGVWSLLFVAITLVALAVLPFVMDRRLATMEQQITGVLEPARRYASDLAVVQARQMSRFQDYLMMGDGIARVRYQALISREDVLTDELQATLESLPLRIRQEMLPLVNASNAWHMGHREALAGEEAREAYLPRMDEDQERYDQALLASQRVLDALADEVEASRARMDAMRSLQNQLTLALVAMALVATAALALLGRRLRGLVSEARKGRHDALRARREFDAILEATGDGVVSLDLDGRATSINAMGARMLGYSEEEARGRSICELVHGRTHEGAEHEDEECPIVEAVKLGVTEGPRDDEVRHRRGRTIPVQWSLRPLVDGRVVRGAVLTLTDMTRVREAESALRRAVRARQETLAVVSHDLRNPLGSVIASAELLLEVPLPRERVQQQLDIIRRAADRMNHLIRDLLDVARIDAGGLSVSPQPTEVEPLLAEVAEMFQARAQEKGVSLERAELDGAVPRVMADRERVLQVLSNLLVNAIRHTGEGGSVTLDVETLGSAALMRVVDTGSGIPPEDLQHLFDRFWRADRSGADQAGLGLAIVRGIVQAHGGEVGVESEVGEGSTFWFTLPLAKS